MLSCKIYCFTSNYRRWVANILIKSDCSYADLLPNFFSKSKFLFLGEPPSNLLIFKHSFCRGRGFISRWHVCNTWHWSILMLSYKILRSTSDYGKIIAQNFIEFHFSNENFVHNSFYFEVHFMRWTSAQIYFFETLVSFKVKGSFCCDTTWCATLRRELL